MILGLMGRDINNDLMLNPFGAEYFEVPLQLVLSLVTKVDSRAERVKNVPNVSKSINIFLRPHTETERKMRRILYTLTM